VVAADGVVERVSTVPRLRGYGICRKRRAQARVGVLAAIEREVFTKEVVAPNEIETSKRGGRGVGFCSSMLFPVLHKHRYNQEDRKSEQNGDCE
jgi:hypothetical protein